MTAHPEIARSALFERLARGHAERVVVLTPNHRLAQTLESDFDRAQVARGLASWEAPDILHFAGFVERAYEEAFYAAGGSELPALLTPAAEQILWEEAVGGGEWRGKLLSVAATAALAADAWKIAHEWRIEGALGVWPGNEDSEAFTAWRAHYQRRTERERLTDGARLPAMVADLLKDGRIAGLATLVLYAFDLVTARQSDFFEACAGAGIEVLACRRPKARAKLARVGLDAPRQELEAAVRWARARLERGAHSPQASTSPNTPQCQGDLFSPQPAAPATNTARIAIVVPDLQKRRAEVVRIFSRTLGPLGFNVSFAPPLSAAPLVDAALAVLELSGGPIAFDRASRLLRSPFIAGAEAEMAARARLDVALRRSAPATLSLPKLRGLIAGETGRRRGLDCPRLVGALDQLLEAAKSVSRAPPHDWARRFTALLDVVGFPGERTLDSREFQTLAKWRELLAILATLDSVVTAWSAAEARARVQRLATDATFQPASGTAPVQVLGILESAGLAFDHLWVCGLTDDAWPLATRPQPLIPPGLQRKAGIPQATPERSLAVDAELTAAWREAAGEVVFSSARADGDRELLVSALVADVPRVEVEALGIALYPTRRDALFAAGRAPEAITTRVDRNAPPVSGPAKGGTGILVDQAACPFRAFAHHRLGARELERPEPGLGPPERGLLLHAMMARLWGELKDQATLLATDAAALDAMIAAAAAHAVDAVRAKHPGPLEGRFAELERERLAGIAREWLEIERGRAPFEVVRIEEPMTLCAGSLRLQGRIDRMDRVLDGDGLAIIDYKTGSNAAPAAWLGPRPDDCQLPLYALAAAQQDVRALAFARLKVGRLGFAGFSRETGLLPGVEPVQGRAARRFQIGSWEALVASWQKETAKLGEDFVAGGAPVDPKNMLSTCERCDLQPLCRVHERIGTFDEGDLFDEGGV